MEIMLSLTGTDRRASEGIPMRRPFLGVCCAFTAGIAAENMWDLQPGTLVIAAAAALIYAVFQGIGRGRRAAERGRPEDAQEASCCASNGSESRRIRMQAALLLCFFCAGALALMHSEYESSRDPLSALAEKDEAAVTVCGEVLSVSERQNGWALEIAVESISADGNTAEKCSGIRTLVRYYDSISGIRRSTGRSLTASGTIALPAQRRNPGCFDYRSYLKTRGINTILTAAEIEPGQISSPITAGLASFRVSFTDRLKKHIGKKDGGTVAAMLFGDKSGLDDDTYEQFRSNGTAHILAVSGLHVGIIYAFISMLIGGRRKLSTNIIMLLALLIYAALAGFSPSVVRAESMIMLHIFSKIFNYRYDLVSAASFAAVVMLAADPYDLFGTGFQMSFLAVFILGFAMPVLERRKKKKGHRPGAGDAVVNMFMPVLAIQAGMAPYSAYVFNYFSFSAFLANVPEIYLAGILIPAAVADMLLMAAASVMPAATTAAAEALQGLMMDIIGGLTDMLMVCNNIFYANGHTAVDVLSPPPVLLAVYYAFFFFLLAEGTRIMILRRKYQRFAVCAALLLAVSAMYGYAADDGFRTADAVFVDVGQGDCLHVRTPSGKNLLIDGGGKEVFGNMEENTVKSVTAKAGFDVGRDTVKPYLLKNGAGRIDLAVVSHMDGDHYSGIASLCREGMVDRAVFYSGLRGKTDKIISDTGLQKDDIEFVSQGDRIAAEKGFYAEVAAPSADLGDENENSLVLKISWGRHSILTTGDIGEAGEQSLLESIKDPGKSRELHCTFVSVPHHGSRYSSCERFVDSLGAAAAVFQVGKNNYGHPAPETVERYRKAGCIIYRNDVNGAVGLFRMRQPGGVRVKTMIDGK